MRSKEDGSLAAAVLRARTGDADAFAELHRLLERRVRFHAEVRLGRRLRRIVDVDDVVQETFYRVFSSLNRLEWKGGGAFRRWVDDVAEKVILRLSRHHLKTKKRPDGEQVPLRHLKWRGVRAEIPTPSRVMRREERRERLLLAIDSLADERRQVILLARIRGLPMRKVAEAMGRSRGACCMLLLRALEDLRRELGETESLTLPPPIAEGDADLRRPAAT